MTLLVIKTPQGKWTEREASYVEKTVSWKEKDKDTFILSVPPLKFLTLEYNFIILRRSMCQLMCCPFHAILNPSTVKCILKMRSQYPHSEKVSHLLKGKYIFFSNVLVPGQRVYNTHKKTHYIDNHKTIKLVGKSISLYISIVSQVALNKIQEPHIEWKWPRNIRNKFQKVENMSKTKKSTSYTSFTKFTYNWI